MTARPVNPASARRLALGTLWMQVAALIVYGVYDALRGGEAWWLGTADVVLATLSLGLWTVLLGVFLRGEVVDASDRRLIAFRLIFPWLIALRAAVWLLSTLAILGDAGNAANPVAVLTLFLVWGRQHRRRAGRVCHQRRAVRQSWRRSGPGTPADLA